MQTMTANEAKTRFGELLIDAQREAVQISKNGKPVAVMMSLEDYEQLEAMKMEMLQAKVSEAILDIEAGRVEDGESFMQSLMAEDNEQTV